MMQTAGMDGSLPESITMLLSDSSGLSLMRIALLCILPSLARWLTWRDRTGRWDGLDPLVLASVPVAVLSLVGVVGQWVTGWEFGTSTG